MLILEEEEMQVQQTIIPPPKVWEVPRCPYCQTPFILHSGEGQSWERWRQSCQCEPQPGCQFPVDQGKWMSTSFHGADIGKTIPRSCILCWTEMREGEAAMLGQMGTKGNSGYAHVACYEQDLREAEHAKEAAERAAQGPSIAIWFSPWGQHETAPNTGHHDTYARQVPVGLPPFPEGSVIYER